MSPKSRDERLADLEAWANEVEKRFKEDEKRIGDVEGVQKTHAVQYSTVVGTLKSVQFTLSVAVILTVLYNFLQSLGPR
jgi:hypothetical protein